MAKRSKPVQESLLSTDAEVESVEDTQKKEAYRRRLAEKLKDPEFRQIEGFPIGTDEAIMALSDPPYYTACPNPFLLEILEEWQKERRVIRKELGLPDEETLPEGFKGYHREPFAADVSEGKNDPIYNAHSYHTKVPHKAIMRYILHYTDPGDIVFDGFCGTGMTGVAAQLCGDKKVVESLGYRVDAKGVVYDGEKAISRLGARKAMLNDLSPAATFIAYNYNNPVDARAFEKEARCILDEVKQECGWMYETNHENGMKGCINFTVWSDVFRCPQCGEEMVFWEEAVNDEGSIQDNWSCPRCGSLLSKSPSRGKGTIGVERVQDTVFDRILNKTITRTRQEPVLINYSFNNKRYEKKPDSDDLSLIKRIEETEIPFPFANNPMMFIGAKWGDSWRAGYHEGITNVHHFYTYRNLWVLAVVFSKIRKAQEGLRSFLTFTFEQAIMGMSKWARYVPSHFSQVNQGLSGTLYIGSKTVEVNLSYIIEGKITRLTKYFEKKFQKREYSITSTQSSSNFNTNNLEKIDYIFVDPPFGGNLMYSELNFITESWLNVVTNNEPEAIVNNIQHKSLIEYKNLIEKSFLSFYRLLKPGHWLTVEFHNSQNSIWNCIQEALLNSGFMIADIRTLDKKQETFKQLTSSKAVKQDLVISAYKPTKEFEKEFLLENGSISGAWEFIRQHLEQLPMPTLNEQIIEVQSERMPYLLYDRMVAFHLVRGLTIPLSAAEFYLGVSQRFLPREGMFFTSSQVAIYDQLRLRAEKVQQLRLFIEDESSAIQWLRAELFNHPQTYAEIQPKFMPQSHQERYEKLPELQILLSQNFLLDEEKRWYVPDPEKAADMEAFRVRDLLREFNEYLTSTGRLKVFRTEAVKAGFSKAWSEHDYATIIKVAERLPMEALQEDSKLKLYYDNALNRAPKEITQGRLI